MLMEISSILGFLGLYSGVRVRITRNSLRSQRLMIESWLVDGFALTARLVNCYTSVVVWKVLMIDSYLFDRQIWNIRGIERDG